EIVQQIHKRAESIANFSLLILFPLFNQLPEAGMLLQLFVFRHWELRTEKKVADGIFMQDPVHQDTLAAPLKINAVIVGAITIKTFAFPLDNAERLGIEAVEVVWQKLELGEQLQLKFLRDSGHFGRTDFI